MTVTLDSDIFNPFNGFLAIWTATTEPATYPSVMSTGCGDCSMPFVFGEISFDTCISIEDVVDNQPWCQSAIAPVPPANEGTHVLPPPPKIFCSDSDSSCPSSPYKKLVASPNFPFNYPNDAEEVKLCKSF